MTADEIRALEKNRYGYDDGAKTALFEIAAQLAELNAKLADGGRPIAVALCASNDIIPVIIQER